MGNRITLSSSDGQYRGPIRGFVRCREAIADVFPHELVDPLIRVQQMTTTWVDRCGWSMNENGTGGIVAMLLERGEVDASPIEPRRGSRS